MSCCSNCYEGLPCSGLGELPPVSSYVVAGSVIAWGGYVRDAAGASRWSDIVENRIKQALWDFGGFSNVEVAQIAGWINQYISIRVTAKVDFARLSDVFDVIQGAIYQSGFRPDAQNFWIESVPPAAATRDDIATPGTGGGRNMPGRQPVGQGFPAISLPNLPDIFGGSTSPSNNGNPIDRLATWLGVGQTEAALIGAGAALAGILIIKKVL